MNTSPTKYDDRKPLQIWLTNGSGEIILLVYVVS